MNFPPRKNIEHFRLCVSIGERRCAERKKETGLLPRHCPMRDAGENGGVDDHWINSPSGCPEDAQTRNSIEQLEDYMQPFENQRLDRTPKLVFVLRCSFCLITE